MEVDSPLTLAGVVLVIITQIFQVVRYELNEKRKAQDKRQRRQLKLDAAIAGVTLPKDSDSEK